MPGARSGEQHGARGEGEHGQDEGHCQGLHELHRFHVNCFDMNFPLLFNFPLTNLLGVLTLFLIIER